MRCAEFYEKWKKHPQFCEMSKDSVKLIDAYIDLGDLLVSRGIDEKVVYINFPEGVARSLIQVREAEVRVEALNFVMGYLKKNEKVPAKDLKNLISGLTKKDKVVKSNADAREEIPTIVGTVRPSSEVKKLDPSKTFSPQPGSIQPFTGLRGVHPSTQACQAARCPNIVSRGGGMAKECTLSQKVPGNTPICPLERRARAELGFISAARMIKGEPVKVVPVGVSKDEAEQKLVDVVRGYMTAKDREALGRILGSGELGDNYVDIFTGLIWWAIERMEG